MAQAKKKTQETPKEAAEPRRGTGMPHRVPAGVNIIDFKPMYDADKDAEDLWYELGFPDGHQEIWHSFWRPGVGWVGPETILTNGG